MTHCAAHLFSEAQPMCNTLEGPARGPTRRDQQVLSRDQFTIRTCEGPIGESESSSVPTAAPLQLRPSAAPTDSSSLLDKAFVTRQSFRYHITYRVQAFKKTLRCRRQRRRGAAGPEPARARVHHRQSTFRYKTKLPLLDKASVTRQSFRFLTTYTSL